VERNLRLKASLELWQFRDRDEDSWRSLTSGHLGAVGSF